MVQLQERASAKSDMVRPLVVLDGGNRFVNWLDASGNCRLIPAIVKELEEWEDGGFDSDSVLIELGDRRWVIGAIAQQLGGKPVFMGEKADLAWLLVAAVLEPVNNNGVVGVEKLRLLCTDRNAPKFKEAANYIESLAWLGEDRRFIRNGKSVSVASIRSVELVDECVPAWRYASKHGWWSYPNTLNGVLDVGGGDTTGRLITSSGIVERTSQVIAPGTKRLASLIAAAIQKHFQHTPDEGVIMDAIAKGTYSIQVGSLNGMSNFDFKPQFDRCVQIWIDEIKAVVKERWQSNQTTWNSIGEVLIVGGSAPLLKPIEVATGGRFKIAKHDAIANFSQSINVFGMLEG